MFRNANLRLVENEAAHHYCSNTNKSNAIKAIFSIKVAASAHPDTENSVIFILCYQMESEADKPW